MMLMSSVTAVMTLAMFTYGKHTVALGHHDPVLDPYTEYVTDTVENDGLMKAMAHYGLI